jgi:hypothetical protein
LLIFSNLLRLDPNFDFSAVLEPLDASVPAELGAKVAEHMEALHECFRRADEEGSGEGLGDHPDDSPDDDPSEAAGENSEA